MGLSLARMLGRRRALRLRAWTLVLVAGAMLTTGLLWLLEMQLASADERTLQPLRAAFAALAISLLALGYMVWRGSVRAPIERLFAHLRERRKKPAQAREEEHLRTLTAEGEKRAAQLNAMVQLNRGLREKLSAPPCCEAAMPRSPSPRMPCC